MTTTTFREHVERIGVFISTTIVFIFIINPILLDVAPILAFQSGDGFERRTGGLGVFSYLATLVAGVYIYYIIIKYAVEDGILAPISLMVLLCLVLIPNKILPEKYHPGTIGQQDIEDWLTSLIPFTGASEDDTE